MKATRSMKKKTPTIVILALIMVVNALSYATIIPLLYPYAIKFGFTPVGMSILFASYSVAQFLATPVLGRLSDRFGRRPIMLICLLGTAVSLGVFAMAKTAAVLFIARMVDGFTGGNVSVAQAIISDTTKGEERAKAFGMLGAAFGFGFLIGPTFGGLLSNYGGMTMPFWFSAFLAVVSAVLCYFLLPETLAPSNKTAQEQEPLFNFSALYHALFKPYVGIVLLMSFIAATSMNAMILGFQAYTVDVMKLPPWQIGAFFSSFGLVGILMQVLAIGPILKRFPSKKNVLMVSTIGSAVTLVAAFFAPDVISFFIAMMAFGAIGAFRDPMIGALLSERTKPEDQGEIMGVNQSYVSLGQIAGPLSAGAVTVYSIQYVFLLAAGFMGVAALAGNWLYVKEKKVNL